MNVTIQRLSSNDKGTLGVMLVDGKPMFTTYELPWRNNQTDISCIPSGTYQAAKMYSNAFKKNVFVLTNVPGRSVIEIHVGNDMKDTHGCILVGLQFGLSDYAIANSLVAFDRFMLMMPSSGFTLTVKDCDEVRTAITTQV